MTLLLKSGQALLLLVAGILIGAALSSFAGGSIGIGACRHNGLDEGVWWQQQFDGFKGNRNVTCVEAEWRSAGKSGFAAGLVHLGYLHGNNLATIDDNTYEKKTYTGGPCESDGKNCLARFIVNAANYGVTLGAFAKAGRFALGGGILFYRSEFNVTVQRTHGEPPAYPELAEFRIVAYHNTPYLDLVFDADRFYARARVYQEINQDGAAYPYKGLTSGPAVALTMGVTF